MEKSSPGSRNLCQKERRRVLATPAQRQVFRKVEYSEYELAS